MTGPHDGTGVSRRARMRRSTTARWRQLTGAASGTAVAFCLLACACTLVAVAGPRASTQARTAALRQIASATPPIQTAVIGTLDANALGSATGGSVDRPQLQAATAQLRRNLARSVPLGKPASDWTGLTTPFADFPDKFPAVSKYPTEVELTYRSNLGPNMRVVAGALPGGKPVTASARAGSTVTVQAAVTTATARRLGLRVGSRVPLTGTDLVLKVSGIVAETDAGGPFWQLDPVVAAPVFVQSPASSPYWIGGAFVAASALPALSTQFNPPDIQLTWVFAMDFGRLTAGQAVSLAGSLPGTLATAGQLEFPGGEAAEVSLSSGAASVLAQFRAQNNAVASVIDLVSVSLAVVAAAVVLLGAWLMAEKRRQEFAVLRARGASRRQLGLAALAGSAVAAVPGVAAGIAIAVLLTPGGGSPLAWWLAAGTLLVALAGPAVITVRMHRGYAEMARPDDPAPRMSALRRLIAEAALALASVGGLIVLRDQGVGSHEDLYASAAPILLAIPVAIVALRLYPLVVRLLLLLASRRTGVTAFLGLARAARVSAAAVLPAFAMVLALSLVSFAGMVRGAVIRGEVAQSWQEAGADAVVSVPVGLSAAEQRAIAAVPGVQHTALLATMSATRGYSASALNVLITGPAQYAALRASMPLGSVPGRFAGWHGGAAAASAGPVPVLASAGAASTLGTGAVTLILQNYQKVRVEVTGSAPAMSQVQAAGLGVAGYVVLPRAALGPGAPAPNAMLVGGQDLDVGALTATVARWHLSGAEVTLRSQLLSALERAPLQHAAYTDLEFGGDAAAIGCLLVLLLTLMLSAGSRQMTLARAATMGMSTAQGRWLALVESLPQIVSVLVGGLACALALAPLVGPALSLSVFTGSAAGVPVRIEPAWLTGTAIALLILAIVTLTGQTVTASRRTPRFLRIGG